MKVSTAIVKLVLRTNKVLSDGSHPIMLRVSYRGTSDRSTSCSCYKKDWDAKAMMLKKGVPNASVVNEKLRCLYRKAIEERDRLDREGKPYTPKKLLSLVFDYVEVKSECSLMDLEESYEVVNAISAQTIPNRRSVVRRFINIVGVSDVREVDTEKASKYVSALLEEGCNEGYVRNCLRILLSLVRFASDRGIPTMEVSKNIGRRLKESRSLYYVHRKTIEYMKERLLSELTMVVDGKRYYREDGVKAILDDRTPVFALYLWLFIYRCQGLAPIDCALLEVNQIREVEVNGKRYWSIDTNRAKTRKAVRIRLPMDGVLENALIFPMLAHRRSCKYFLPILEGVDKSKVRDKLSSRLFQLRPHLKKLLKDVNMTIRSYGNDVPLIDLDRVNFYTARHSFAQAYLSSPNASPLALASLMGRSVNTLATYVQQLSLDKDIVEAMDGISL